MGWITDWVRNIFIMVAAVSFVEILLPGGSMGKYVKFILSLMILAVVLYPFSLLSGNQPISPGQPEQPFASESTSQPKQPFAPGHTTQPQRPSDPEQTDQPQQQDKSEDSGDRLSSESAMAAQPVPANEDPLSAIQTKQIQEVYQEKLEQALKEQILSKFNGIQTATVHIYMNNDITKRSYGKIRKVVISLAPASLADPVRSFAAETLSMSRGQIQVTDAANSINAADQTGDTGG